MAAPPQAQLHTVKLCRSEHVHLPEEASVLVVEPGTTPARFIVSGSEQLQSDLLSVSEKKKGKTELLQRSCTRDYGEKLKRKKKAQFLAVCAVQGGKPATSIITSHNRTPRISSDSD